VSTAESARLVVMPVRPSGSSTVLVTAPCSAAYCAVKTGG
jgi:hypothetical protein